MTNKSTSSGASDTSDYMESLSVSSFSSCDVSDRHVTRPRSGKEYASIDRTVLALCDGPNAWFVFCIICIFKTKERFRIVFTIICFFFINKWKCRINLQQFSLFVDLVLNYCINFDSADSIPDVVINYLIMGRTRWNTIVPMYIIKCRKSCELDLVQTNLVIRCQNGAFSGSGVELM